MAPVLFMVTVTLSVEDFSYVVVQIDWSIFNCVESVIKHGMDTVTSNCRLGNTKCTLFKSNKFPFIQIDTPVHQSIR